MRRFDSRRWFPAMMVLALAVTCTAAPAADFPYKLRFQVYEGPHDKTGQRWKSKTVELVPGSKEAQEWLEAHRASCPGLVKAYEELTASNRFTTYMRDLQTLEGARPTITLVDDSRKYVDADKDGKPDTGEPARDEEGVWPHARGGNIFISQSYFGTYTDVDSVHELLIHEFSHTQDHTGRGLGDYGPDDSHFGDEELYNHGHNLPFFWQGGHYSPRAAFLEGWANFTPLVFEPDGRDGMVSSIEEIRRETEKGKYTMKPWKEASFDELISVEYVNSLILFDLYRFIPGAKDKIWAAFRETNHGGRTLVELLARLVADHPEDAFAVAAIFDAYTRFQASDSTLDKLLGKDLAAVYRREHRGKAKEQNASGTVGDAEDVGRWAAANLRVPAAEASLALLDRRLAGLRGWHLSPLDIIGGPGAILVRHYLQERERARLEALRRQVAAELERLRAEQAARNAAVTRLQPALMLPPAAGVPVSVSPEEPATAPPPPAGRPAATFDGAPVPWGR
ncbi:MAG: hypothetical protein HY814_07560 [Candidatus Riflebacteria bacterium]|nr:hypothetical protein [Candidatus Riflebacteria bacterium]